MQALCMHCDSSLGSRPRPEMPGRQLKRFPFPHSFKAVCHKPVDEFYWVFDRNQYYQSANSHVIAPSALRGNDTHKLHQ